jgi:polyisoprenyl-phosphate glycosyltransferase
MTTPVYSVAVPVYNAAQTLGEFTQRLTAVMQQLQQPYQIIFVDDCSKDASWQTLLGLQQQYPNIKLYQLQNNSGQHTATLCGALKAEGEVIITIDDDLQISPEDIPALLQKKQESGAQLVYGHFQKKQQSGYKNLSRTLLFFVLKRMLKDFTYASSFRVFDAGMVKEIDTSFRRYYTFDVSLILQKPSMAFVNIPHYPRKQGSSNYKLRYLVGFVASYFINFTLLPVRLLLFAGVLMAVFGFLSAIYAINRQLTYALIGTVISCTGIILMGLALWAEYFARYMQANSARTLFVINQRSE